eukprot:CAMPEP_0184869890 /NCGR_PEP_ID=MMETSP0580-20130426/35710_1 /TAXON_ID=1118495 /ORGANISM="Dactyliosolen fragilissimus" /LENGTH=406 /DNA_ID=CAMNT_0027371685 /DNA_START=66 /DNA_END=1286 /DNA_ORIENTATION=-
MKSKRKLTLQDEIKNARQKEEMHDVDLVGYDGVRVPAVRFLLGARSEVFRKMLYGEFKEGSSSEVCMPKYSQQVLMKITDYCFGEPLAYEFANREAARTFVQIFDCAHYLGMEGLEDLAIEIVEKYCSGDTKKPLEFLCAIYDEATNNPSAERIKNVVIDHLRLDMSSLKEGVYSLGKKALSEIISDPMVEATEMELFDLILRWLDNVVDSSLGSEDHTEETIIFAKECVESIHLGNIDPTDLAETVSKSGLVSDEMLLKAFQFQAFKAKDMGFGEFKKVRREFVHEKVLVENSGIDTLNGVYICNGTFDGVSKYVKSGKWKDKDVEFTLYRCPIQTKSIKRWYISIVPNNLQPGTDNDIDFYLAPATGKVYELPIEKTWQVAKKNGINPPPKVSCSIFNDVKYCI